ncbi:MAG: MarR family transcriptional regulator [Methanobacteriota archaeon]|nr:MAG: MarR family transcriptional regulator [Euryarchaeota archaeon]
MRTKVIVDSVEADAPARSVLVSDRPERLGPLNHPEAWRILSELARRPDYPGSLAKRLRMHEQTVYYHVHRLAKAGLIHVVREERRQGAVSRVFAPSAEAFGVELPGPGRARAPARPAVPERVRQFLEPFLREGGILVIGSPYQHGPFLTVARDSPYAVELGLFLGRIAGGSRLSVRLDTEVKGAGLEGKNLVLVGGPVANILALDLNPHLRVTFDWQQAWRMRSSFTGREYADEDVGLLAKIPNPWNPETQIAMFSGLHHSGTSAAVLALVSHADQVLRDQVAGRAFYRVVQGLDRDGDGRVDSVEVLE